MERWRGLKSLVVDAVEHGSRAVERVQKETARRPFEILARIPPLEVPVKGIHVIHDTAVGGVHGMIRFVNKVVGIARCGDRRGRAPAHGSGARGRVGRRGAGEERRAAGRGGLSQSA